LTPSLRHRLAAEGLGAALLFATVVGSGIMAERLAAGNDAVALLANALATGAILYVLITMLGPVSGAHMNPAVSAVAAWRRELPVTDAALYAVVQTLCGIGGVWVAHLMFGVDMIQVSAKARDGAGQWLAEGVATFGLVLTILGAVRHRPESVPASVALYIVAAYWFTASTSFANPAITVARSLTDSFAGIAPADVPGFVAAQIVGASVAAVGAGWLSPPRD
jgi:glycerol uptake facilitator-like aquaporin